MCPCLPLLEYTRSNERILTVQASVHIMDRAQQPTPGSTLGQVQASDPAYVPPQAPVPAPAPVPENILSS